MLTDPTLLELFRYNDQTNDRLLALARPLTDAQLDQSIDVGLGSIRRILRHVLAGEATWLKRWSGNVETPWPDEKISLSIDELSAAFAEMRAARTAYFQSISDADLDRVQPYRDSKGNRFTATLRQMLLQGALHSHHHRAQIGNALKRVASVVTDLDYMQTVRVPG
jgi:uncharacterized damage-inducible protein DinB